MQPSQYFTAPRTHFSLTKIAQFVRCPRLLRLFQTAKESINETNAQHKDPMLFVPTNPTCVRRTTDFALFIHQFEASKNFHNPRLGVSVFPRLIHCTTCRGQWLFRSLGLQHWQAVETAQMHLSQRSDPHCQPTNCSSLMHALPIAL